MARTIVIAGVDGYIGNALAQRMLKLGHRVVGIDIFMRRNYVDFLGSFSAVSILSMNEKIKRYQEIGDFTFYRFNICNYNKMCFLLKSEKPDVIFNLAHNPSAPYSQVSQEQANQVLQNNILGTNSILWAIKETCPDVHYITIGTTGEYDHYSNIDIEEGYFYFTHNGRCSNEMIYPRRPGSVYHVSKTASTYLIDLLAKVWNLRCTDIQQSIVFGMYTDEINQTGIYSRLDSDECFGTVLNRFIIQAVLDVPLTIYGEGKHKRGFLSLNDSIQALEIALNNSAKKGQVQTWNQLSEWCSMNDLVDMIVDTIECPIQVDYLPTPRSEITTEHYYNYITKKLTDKGYKPTRTIQEEVNYTYRLLLSQTLTGLEEFVIPKITWR